MIKLKVSELAEILQTEPIFGEGNREELASLYVDGFCYDSRKIRPTDLFIPYRGENVDAHVFISDVLETASVTLTEDIPEAPLPGKVYLHVNNSGDAVQEIALQIRNRYTKPVVGVTGSVGKTTTREMITHVLESGYRVFHTEGNQNSQVGVPMTLSGILDRETDCAVIEMGISMEGEMDRLSRMTKPAIAVVTNIGVSHMEYLGSQEGIRKEKLKIISRMDETGVVFLNADDPLLYAVKDELPVQVKTYGFREDADIRGTDMQASGDGMRFTVTMDGVSSEVSLSVQGEHNVRNALAALGVAATLGLSREKAEASLSTFAGSRQRILHINEMTVIDDAYNASPDSMKAALSVLLSREGRRVAVLGDMFELGKNEIALHESVGEFIRKEKETGRTLSLLVTAGPLAEKIGEAAGDAVPEILHFADTQAVKDSLPDILKAGDAVLFKASNGMHFRTLVETLEEDK